MDPLDEERLADEALKDSLIKELAAAVDARLKALNLSQAVVWISGYVVGRIAKDSSGLAIAAYENPLQISLLDSFDPVLESALITREQGG